jgi:hypothetical protein
VAALAVCAELPFMDIFMAGRAVLREAHEGLRAGPCAPGYGTSRTPRPHAFPPKDIRPVDDRIA